LRAGSFTGLRVGLAAAHGLAIGWRVPLSGYSAPALLAAMAGAGGAPVAAALQGGHGQLFVQSFTGEPLEPADALRSLTPDEAALTVRRRCVVGRAPRNWWRREALVTPSTSCPEPPAPSCSPSPSARCRPPDLRPRARRQEDERHMTTALELAEGGVADLPHGDERDGKRVRAALRRGLDAFTMRRAAVDAGRVADAGAGRRGLLGFSLSRIVADEAELLLLAVKSDAQRSGIGKALLGAFEQAALGRGRGACTSKCGTATTP
jgi:GNAT superfamily N-acetyltransferase